MNITYKSHKIWIISFVCIISTQYLYLLFHQHFGHVFIQILRIIWNKGLIKGLPQNISNLGAPFLTILPTKDRRIYFVDSINIPNFTSSLMLQIDFDLFNVEIIHGFISTLISTCYSTLHRCDTTTRRKKLNFGNPIICCQCYLQTGQNLSYIIVYGYFNLDWSTESSKTCHNMRIIVQTTGVDDFCLHEAFKLPTKHAITRQGISFWTQSIPPTSGA